MKATRLKLQTGLIGVFLMLQFPSLISAEQLAPTEVITAAREGLRTFLNEIEPQHLYELGFINQGDIEAAELGEGFQVFTIPPESVTNYARGQELQALIEPTTIWEFLIESNGEARAVLTVDFFKGKWTAVGIGASGLATQLKKVLETWPAYTGYNIKLIRIYQASSDFVQISEGEIGRGIVPLNSGRVALGLDRHRFNAAERYDEGEIIEGIKPKVKDNMMRSK
jgi:hypothetical protein